MSVARRRYISPMERISQVCSSAPMSLGRHRHRWATSTEYLAIDMVSEGLISSDLLDVGARITLRIDAHTRLTARQKFSWWATGINLKFTTCQKQKQERYSGRKLQRNATVYCWKVIIGNTLSYFLSTTNPPLFLRQTLKEGVFWREAQIPRRTWIQSGAYWA